MLFINCRVQNSVTTVVTQMENAKLPLLFIILYSMHLKTPNIENNHMLLRKC